MKATRYFEHPGVRTNLANESTAESANGATGQKGEYLGIENKLYEKVMNTRVKLNMNTSSTASKRFS